MGRGERIIAILVITMATVIPSVTAQSKYSETITVMQAVYSGELLAHARYLAIAAKALEEKYPHIAYLATALASSEGVHARNFRDVLTSLSQAVDDQQPAVTVSDTKANLKLAANAELAEIDTRYPQYLKRIQPEGNQEAIDDLTHAWESEKQHRDLVTQLLSGTGIMFGVLVRTIEGKAVTYLICQKCGSTLDELPKDKCPICGGPVSNYRKIEPPG